MSYDRILRITQGLAEASIEMFENDDAVLPGNMRQGIFTVGAKDNVDKDRSCIVTKSHYHGTSLSLFQFPSAANNGIERKYEKFVKINSCGSKKVKDLPRFYVDVNEIYDPPSTFFLSAPTTNAIDDLYSGEILDSAIKAEFDWLEYVASSTELTEDVSWSVHHSKRVSDEEKIKSVNSILPLLRQNVRTFNMQKHCIEITKAAIDVLNPGQIVVGVSDQPIYTISRILQQHLPNKFGPGLYFPMFGGLHIEKLLLEIHGKMIEGNGLSEVLDVSHLSMTGAGNTLVNVPRITSARYLVQVCLCAEFKALQDVYSSSESALDIRSWMDEMADASPMFHYWKVIFDFH